MGELHAGAPGAVDLVGRARRGRVGQLAAVPRAGRHGGRRRRRGAARDLERHRERGVEGADSGAGVVEPDRLGRPGVPHVGRRRGGVRGSAAGPVRAGERRRRSSRQPPLDRPVSRPGQRRAALAADRAPGAGGVEPAPQELVRVGHAGDRRHAGVRAVRRHRPLRLRLRRRPDLVARHRGPAGLLGLGSGSVAGAARRSGARDARQRANVVSRGVRCRDRRGELARAAGRAELVVDAVRLGRTTCARRSSRRRRTRSARTTRRATCSGTSRDA